ncbi:MAG: transporter [Candidatus Eisenbacteria bacterium]|nr:transporter [Candidatus Eisenbacteria bacterium]
MRSTLCAVIVLALVGMASTAGAYDFLYSGDKAATHDQGAFGINVGLWYFMADKVYDSEGESQDLDADWTAMYFPMNFYYAVMDQMEIGVKPNFQMLKLKAPDDMRTEDEITGTGLGDTWIYAKYMFMPEPMMTARLGLKIATGNSEPEEDEIGTSEGQMDIDGALMVGMPAGPGVFDVALGYRYRLENSDTKCTPGSEIHFCAGYAYPMSDMLALKIAADGYFGSDDKSDPEDPSDEDSGRNVVYINPGIDYTMANGMTLGADFHYPLMGKNVPAEWGLGLYFGWGK